MQGSNLRPSGCKPDALPSELTARWAGRDSNPQSPEGTGFTVLRASQLLNPPLLQLSFFQHPSLLCLSFQ